MYNAVKKFNKPVTTPAYPNKKLEVNKKKKRPFIQNHQNNLRSSFYHCVVDHQQNVVDFQTEKDSLSKKKITLFCHLLNFPEWVEVHRSGE